MTVEKILKITYYHHFVVLIYIGTQQKYLIKFDYILKMWKMFLKKAAVIPVFGIFFPFYSRLCIYCKASIVTPCSPLLMGHIIYDVAVRLPLKFP